LELFLDSVAALNARRPLPVMVIVDEAYYEYAKAFAKDYPDTLALQKRFPFLLVMRTYSKAHALAGLRIGYAFAEVGLIDALDRVRPPFNVSIAAQVAGEASLSDKAHIRRAIQLVQRERVKVEAALDALGLPYLPSVANFVLIDFSPRKGREVFERLLDRGIITRAMDEYGFPQHLRVTYGLPAENSAFIKALTEVLQS
jgi:histidinol-phosphate aminotransferase